jgi:hypothetical protein
MKREVERQLHSLFDARDKAHEKAVAQATEREIVEAKNLSDFLDKKDTLIRPALQEIVNVYQERGAFARIVETSEDQNSRSPALREHTIGLDLAGPGYHDRTMKPAFTFYFTKGTRGLRLHTTSSWKSASAGEVALDAVSADWIHAEFLKYRSEG